MRSSTGLIVTADDFGLSEEANRAIVEALERGLVTHASLMANMAGFDGAVEVARQRGLLGRVGVHLVLTEGSPLTEPMQSCSRFCNENGRFRYWRSTDHALRLNRAERYAVSTELRAQILRCRERGVGVSHVDSHHHVHNKLAISRVVIALARDLQVPRVRVAHNCGPHIGLVNGTYKGLINSRLRRAGLAGTRSFGGIDDLLHLTSSGKSTESLASFEVNTHPAHRNGLLVDWIVQPDRPLEDLLRECVAPR